MSSAQILVLLAVATALLALWAAAFATRADMATRRAMRLANERWDAATKPVPHLSFAGPPAPGHAIDLDVENLGGPLAAGGVIVQAGDELYATELTLPEKAPSRRISVPFVLKAWQRTNQPRILMLVVRDVGGRCWDCIDGNKQIKDPRRWLAGQLREMRLQGVVDFPAVAGPAKR